jgi:hypothetical protein
MRVNAKQFVNLSCSKCNEPFSKEKKEYDRQIKNGKTKFYCQTSCVYEGTSNSKKNELSPFMFVIRSTKKTAKFRKFDFNLTSKYLKGVWEKQAGRCPYTRIQLEYPTYKYAHSPRKASLDRIDSSKGYVEGNVEFVCVFVNLGKNGFGKQEILSILEEYKNGVVTKA